MVGTNKQALAFALATTMPLHVPLLMYSILFCVGWAVHLLLQLLLLPLLLVLLLLLLFLPLLLLAHPEDYTAHVSALCYLVHGFARPTTVWRQRPVMIGCQYTPVVVGRR